MAKGKTKDEVAKELAQAHFEFDDGIASIYRIRVEERREQAEDEPIKLLEVNAHTVPAGVMPVIFGPTEEVPFSSIVVELTPSEFEEIKEGKLRLPDGWQRDDRPLEERGARV